MTTLEPDFHHALSFLQALTGESDPEVLFAAISDAPGPRTAPRHYRGSLRALWPVLRGENAMRNGIFVTVNETRGDRRTAADVIRLRAVFIDQDHPPFINPADCHVPPSIMVNTGKGRHTYWILKEGQDLNEFSAVQRRLIARYNSDPQVNDLPRVMRVPGFYHHKAEPRRVEWFDVDPDGKAFYSISEVSQGLPIDPSPTARKGPVGYRLPDAGTRKVVQSDFAKLEKGGKVPLWAAEMVSNVVSGGRALLDPAAHLGEVDNLVTRFLTWTCGRFPDATLESLMEVLVHPWTLLSALDSAAGRPSYSVDDLVSKLSRAQAFIRESHQAEMEEHPWLDMVARDEQGMVIASRSNLEIVLRFHPKWKKVLGFDERSRRYMYRASAPWIGLPWAPTSGIGDGPPGAEGQTISEHHAGLFAQWFAQAEHLHLTRLVTSVIHEAVEAVAFENGFDPFRDWLESQTWDGKPRLVKWLSTYLGTADDEWTRAVGPRWLIAAVARTFEPGCKVDEMLVLEGAQGTRKSSALRALAGAAYFTDSLPRGGDPTDMATALVGPVIVEIPEIDGVNRKREASEVKAFLSKQVDRYRPKYGRREVEVPRRCVFAGSTNESEYLVDHTGGRRFWPVRVGVSRKTMDVDGLMEDRGQLWAEARAYYDMGMTWHLNEEESDTAAHEVQERQESDPWVEVISEFVRRGGGGANTALGVALGTTTEIKPLVEVSMDTILGRALAISEGKRTNQDARRAAIILKGLGFAKCKSHGRMIWKRGT